MDARWLYMLARRGSYVLSAMSLVTRPWIIHLALWVMIGGSTVAIALAPDARIAAWSPTVSTAICAVAASVGLSLFQLGLLHFSAIGRRLELYVGIGFGTLALSNVISGFMSAMSQVPVRGVELGSSLVLFGHVLADVILVFAVAQASSLIPPSNRTFVAAAAIAVALGAFVFGTAGVFLAAASNPGAELSAPALDELRLGLTVQPLWRDEAAWMVSVRLLLAVLLAFISYRITFRVRDTGDSLINALVPGTLILAVAELHGGLFPQGAPGYVSTSDVFRLVAYLTLLIGLTMRTTSTLAINASAEERLRLSRELHDGLAQQLAALQFRIGQALTESVDGNQRLRRNLQVCHRLTQESLLEARQAITALRSGTVAWEDFVAVLETFCVEAADNHDVRIELSTSGGVRRLPASIQLEVLRILNETVSNAVRHGHSTKIDVHVATQSHPLRLALRIRDDGRGFVPGGQQIGDGVGMRSLVERLAARGGSLRLESVPSSGTSIHAEIPLPDDRTP